MTEPAPAWPVTPQPIDPVTGTPLASPPSPPPAGGMPAAIQLQQPVGQAATLDATAPLLHAAPSFAAPHAPPPMPPLTGFAGEAPHAFAAPAAPGQQPAHPMPAAQHEEEYPVSLAMPVQQAYVAEAMPTFESAMEPSFAQPIDAAVFGAPGEHAQLHAMPDDLDAEIDATGASASVAGTWRSPGLALIVAMAALAWQLVSHYAREQLPALQSSGAVLDNFDRIIGSMPLIGGSLGPFIGAALGAGSLLLVFLSMRSGVREPVLQGAVVLLGGIALLAPIVLPMLFG